MLVVGLVITRLQIIHRKTKIFDEAKIRWQIVQVEAIDEIFQTNFLYDSITHPSFHANSIVINIFTDYENLLTG